MKISIQFKDLQVTASDRQRIEDRIRLALTRFAPLIHGLIRDRQRRERFAGRRR